MDHNAAYISLLHYGVFECPFQAVEYTSICIHSIGTSCVLTVSPEEFLPGCSCMLHDSTSKYATGNFSIDEYLSAHAFLSTYLGIVFCKFCMKLNP